MFSSEMFDVFRQAAGDAHNRVLLYFSSGSDSVVCLDVLKEFGCDVHLVNLCPLPGVPYYTDPVIAYAEKYNCTWHQQIDPEFLQWVYERNGRKINKLRRSDSLEQARDYSGYEWACWGFINQDSLGRALVMKKSHGIDYNTKQFYPLYGWKKKHVMAYINRRNVKLIGEYSRGNRNIDNLKDGGALYLRNMYPESFQKLATAYPFLKTEAIRQAEMV